MIYVVIMSCCFIVIESLDLSRCISGFYLVSLPDVAVMLLINNMMLKLADFTVLAQQTTLLER